MSRKISKAHVERMTRNMFAAIKANDADGVRTAIKGGANPKATRHGYTAAAVALCLNTRWGLEPKSPSIEVVRELLEGGSLPSLPGSRRCYIEDSIELTPEWFDLFHGFRIEVDDHVISRLVHRGAIELWDHCKDRIQLKNYRENGELTELHKTIYGGKNWSGYQSYRKLDPQRIDRLLDAGCGIEERVEGDTPLILAIKMGDQGAVEVLLRRGADVSAKDGWDRTLEKVLSHVNSSEQMVALVSRYLLSASTLTPTAAQERRRL